MLKKFISYYKNHMGLFILDLFAATGVAGITLTFPWITKIVIDDLIPSGEVNKIVFYIALLAGLYILKAIFTFIIDYYGHVMGTRLERDMRSDLFRKFQTLDTKYFDDNKTGVLMTRLVGNLRDISEMSHHAPETLFVSTLMIIGSFIILLRTSVTFTIIVFVAIIFLIVFMILRRKKMINSFRETRTTHAEINSQVESSLGGIRLTKAYTNEELEKEKFERINHDYQHSWNNAYFQMGVYSAGTQSIMDFISVLVLGIGSVYVINGEITIGVYASFFLYMNYIMRPIRDLVMMLQQIQLGWSGFEKFYEIITIEPEIKSKDDAVTYSTHEGNIEFDNVSFKYNDEHKFVINNLSLKIDKGQTIGIVGETGVGKSTIAKLIPRFYEVNSGKIKLDGNNIQDYDVYSLRNAIGHVQQDVYIFFGSIYDNVLYGRSNATYEEVVDACKKANIHDFIQTLEHGYDSLVGERGVKLSGGQKQRISIARLFLKNPSILILDEATSSLDNITEKLIQEPLNELSKDKTRIVIAHRLSTIIDADLILVLDEKGIKEQGTHRELIANDGYYKKLYTSSLES